MTLSTLRSVPGLNSGNHRTLCIFAKALEMHDRCAAAVQAGLMFTALH